MSSYKPRRPYTPRSFHAPDSLHAPSLFDIIPETDTSPIATAVASHQSREHTLDKVRNASRTVMPVLEAWQAYYEGRPATDVERSHARCLSNANNFLLEEGVPVSLQQTLKRLNRLGSQRFSRRCRTFASRALSDPERIVADLEGSAPYGMLDVALRARDPEFDKVDDRHFAQSVRSTLSPIYDAFYGPYIRPHVKGASIATLPRSWQDRLFTDCLTLRASQIVPGLLAALEKDSSVCEDDTSAVWTDALTATISGSTIEKTSWSTVIRGIFVRDAVTEDVPVRYLPHLQNDVFRAVTEVLTRDESHGFNDWVSFDCSRDTTYLQYRMDLQRQERVRADGFLRTVLDVRQPLRRLSEAVERSASVKVLNSRINSALGNDDEQGDLVDAFGRVISYADYHSSKEPYPLRALRTEWVRALETRVMLTLVEYVLDAEDIEFLHWDVDRMVVRPTGSSSADYREAFREVNDAYQRSLESALWQIGVYEPAPPTSLTIEDGARWLSEEILNRCPSGDRLDVIGL